MAERTDTAAELRSFITPAMALRWAVERAEREAAHNGYPNDPEVTALRDALAIVEKHSARPT